MFEPREGGTKKKTASTSKKLDSGEVAVGVHHSPSIHIRSDDNMIREVPANRNEDASPKRKTAAAGKVDVGSIGRI